jgi:hypothetical protein
MSITFPVVRKAVKLLDLSEIGAVSGIWAFYGTRYTQHNFYRILRRRGIIFTAYSVIGKKTKWRISA